MCKNSTIDLTSSWALCLSGLFWECSDLITAPYLPATTLTMWCYRSMFFGCTSLISIPELPATTLPSFCYYTMFMGCANIKLSTEQTLEYQTPYRIPSSWTGTDGGSLDRMFYDTWWEWTWTPTINQTYYTSNTVI